MKRPDPVRDRLLSAGRALFCSRGFDAVSVRELTSRAKANLGAITYHFGSKEALYHATIDSIALPFAASLEAASRAPGSALDRVEAVVRAALDRTSAEPGVPTLVLRELANDRPLPVPMARLMKRNIGIVMGIVIEGQRDGTVRPGDPALLALSVVSQPFYFRIAGRGLEQAMGLARNDPHVWDRVVEHVVLSVRHTIAATPEDAAGGRMQGSAGRRARTVNANCHDRRPAVCGCAAGPEWDANDARAGRGPRACLASVGRTGARAARPHVG
jgi:AcrR family transcriptional regulator